MGVPPEPDWLADLGDLEFIDRPQAIVDDAVTFAQAIEAAWSDHNASRDEDEPLADERPGGATFARIYAEGEAAGGRQWSALSPDERADVVERAAVGRRRRLAAPGSPGGLTVLSWADLLAEPLNPPPTILPGIPKVGLVVVAGAPKIGKTLWLSQRVLEARLPTLLVIEEGSRAGISYRLRKQALGLGIRTPPLTVMHLQRIRLDDRKSIKRLRAHVEAVRPSVVGFDPLNRLHSADENRPSQMTPIMDVLASLAYDFECSVIAIHHMSKPSAERRGDIWDRFRGASSIRSGTDANLVLDGSTDRVHLVGEFRDGEPMSEWLELDRETLLFSPGGAPEATTKIDPIELRRFVESQNYVTKALTAERFRVSLNTAADALSRLGADELRGPRNERRWSFTTRQ